ncbi:MULTISPECIES: hypothetical protein [Lactobacillales]|uniref:Uncharacterized protein n=4 Tax=Lactobacillales TaxID=186826 RepID=A0A9E4DSM9_9ENTE|nr:MULTISPECIES: hypothetical protein [Lactobacillales]MBK8156297.1 hypothetical protein [Streptococcus sp.]MCC9274502.1 hypothetical protein [Enterococcus aquimarinus]HIZ53274.1 hypothetical protein [Candidatus Enterococcus avicola]MBP8751132.1 hypothetical protein [Enterococcus sp.]QII82863.1 hypothetical protein G7057_10695 [Jeotgalibaca arthritidis]
MEKNKQSIVPVILQNDQNNRRTVEKSLPQKLVAHLKSSQTELLIYEGIKQSTLKILLTEMSINEAH